MTPRFAALLRLAHGAMTPRSVDRLLERYGSPEVAVEAIERRKAEVPDGIRNEVVVSAADRLARLSALGVAFVSSEGLPARLDRIGSGPRWLFVDGALADQPTIGIVGTRTCTQYGLELAGAYGAACADRGWVVASGLARGIDAAAHEGVVAHGGRAIAVLGSGIDVMYPRSNRGLSNRILEAGGAVCSEFPPGTRPDRWRFPARNRIIAGLSDVLIVVEAGETGGALITSRIALEHGIPVWATPGDIDRPASAGTNALIRDGAFPVFGPDDLGAALDLIVALHTRSNAT